MASFKFKLEQVLGYRAQLEEQATLALANARHARDLKEQELQNIKNTLVEHEREWTGKSDTSISELWLAGNYSEGLKADIIIEQNNLASLARKFEKCRVDLVKKAQERDLLDKLKLRQAERYEHEEKQKELKIYDETATLRHKAQPI